jgi:hypothetical protein
MRRISRTRVAAEAISKMGCGRFLNRLLVSLSKGGGTRTRGEQTHGGRSCLSYFCVVLVFFLGSACAPVKRRTFEEPLTEYSYHTVMYPGETLAIIARWYTGQSGNWEALLDHNPEVNPRRLRLGDLVKIPQELLIRDDAMPKKFVDKANAKVASKTPAKPAPTQGGAVEAAVAATEGGAQPASVDAAAAVAERPTETVTAESTGSEAAAIKSDARTKTRDELLQELLQEQ